MSGNLKTVTHVKQAGSNQYSQTSAALGLTLNIKRADVFDSFFIAVFQMFQNENSKSLYKSLSEWKVIKCQSDQI